MKRPGTASSSASRPGTAKSTSSGGGGGAAATTSKANAAGSPHNSNTAAAVASQGAANAPGSAAAALLDQMERLLGDADARFVERSRTLIEAAKSSAAGVALHVDRGGASLRQQVAHNHGLMADRRFKEMLDECEKCLAPEFSLRGDVLDRALQAMLASLLKTLLKEAAALSSPAARKVQIEMTFQWWQDKKRDILDVVLSRMPKSRSRAEAAAAAAAAASLLAQQQADANGGRAGDDDADAVSPAQRAVLAALQAGDPRDSEGPPLSVQPCAPLSLHSDATAEKDRSAVAQKLRLYMKHDVAAGHAVRTGQHQQQQQGQQLGVVGVGLGIQAQHGSPQRGTVFQQPRVVMNAANNNKSFSASPGSKTKLRGTGGLHQQQQQPQQQYHGAAREDAPAGPAPFQHIAVQAAPRGHVDKDRPPGTVDESMALAHQRLVRHAAQQLEDRFSDREAIDMNAALSHNRARLLEETARKLEAREFSSQSARTTHLILAKVRQSDGALVDARTRLPSARYDKEHAASADALDGSVSPGTPRSPLRGPLSPVARSHSISGLSASVRSGGGLGFGRGSASATGDASAAVLAALKKVAYQGQDVSLSPYDHYQLRPQDEHRLKSLMERIEHVNDPTCAAGNRELPPVSPKFAVFDDMVLVPHAKRHDLRVLQPQGVAGSAYANKNTAQRGPGRPTSAPPVKRIVPAGYVPGKGAAAVLSPLATSSAHAQSHAGGGSSPLSPSSPSAPVLSPALQQKATLPNLMRDLFPEVFDGHDELPPSMRRLEEMKLVDRVRDAFARRNPEAMPGYDRLVRALVAPDDLPHEVCARHLPRPGSGYPRKFTIA
jgi:hypothetical protein